MNLQRLLVEQVHITPIIADIKAGGADTVPFVHDIADN